jgi:membrane protein
VTYYALISLFPLVIFIVSVGAFFITDSTDQERLIDELMQALPLSEEDGRSGLEETIDQVVSNRGALGIVGLLATVYTAGALFTSVRVALNGVFHVEQQRPFVIGKAIDLGLVVGFGVLLMASFALTVAIAFAQQQADALVGERLSTLVAWLASLAYLLIPPLVTGLVFLLLYANVARAGFTTRQVLPGVIVAALLFEALKVGFTWYVASFGNYDATYGALGFVIILLLFFNLSAQVMLVGAEVARANAEVLELERTGGGRPALARLLAGMRSAYRKGRGLPVVGRLVPNVGWLAVPDEAASAAEVGAPGAFAPAEPVTSARPIMPRPGGPEAAPRAVDRDAGAGGISFRWWAAATAAGVAFVAWLSGQER